MTPFPNAEDYVRAVQDPERVFRVPALRKAEFALHPVWQIPVPASGNAAVVFKARVDGVDQAIRFFIREDASSRQRYTALGEYFARHGLGDCVAGASWLDDAISVNNSSWPMVQMSWVDGRTLDAYVGYLVERGDVTALRNLATTWRALIDRLQRAEFAHGDLQHGNVLIDTASTLRLVDFDGSWIGTFRGESPPHETGHPNYQRTGREWGRWMDTFPGLVIYTALLGLSKSPTPWAALSTGENILFTQEDFAPPFDTKTWRQLSGIGDPELDSVTARLKTCCDSTWAAADSLEALLSSPPSILMAAAVGASGNPLPRGGPSADRSDRPWWELTAGAVDARLDTPSSGPTTGGTEPTGSNALPPPPMFGVGPASTPPGSVPGLEPTSSWYGVGAQQPAAPRPAPADARMPWNRAVALALVVALVAGVITFAIVLGSDRPAPALFAGIVVAVLAAAVTLPALRRYRR